MTIYSITKSSFQLFFCFVFSIIICQQSFANKLDYRYKKSFDIQKLSLKQGLSQTVVNDIIQDHAGFLWFATQDGLNRFDGYEFLVYRHDHKDPSSLHANGLISLELNPGKGLWIGTVAGLSYFDFKTEVFTNYGLKYPVVNRMIMDVLYENGKGIWVATDNGLYFQGIDQQSENVFKNIPLESGSTKKASLKSIAQDEHHIYASTQSCLYSISKLNHIVKSLCDKKIKALTSDSELTSILVDQKTLWIGTTNGLFEYDLNLFKINETEKNINLAKDLSSDWIQDLSLDQGGNLWIATTKGIKVFDNRTKIVTTYKQTGFGGNQLSSMDILSSFIDIDGHVWLGTYGKGINLLNPNQLRFEQIYTSQEAAKINSNNTILGIAKDQYENLWLASYGGGLVKYNLVTGNISRPTKAQQFSHSDYVFNLLIDKDNLLWVATLEEVFILDLENSKVKDVEIEVEGEEEGTSISVSSFFEDQSGTMWLLSERGLFKEKTRNFNIQNIQASTPKIVFESWNEKIPYSYRANTLSVSSMVQDQQGNYWIGGEGGLLYFDTINNVWEHFSYNPSIPNSLSSNMVQVLFIDSQGIIWVGTADGLNQVKKIETSSKKIIYFDRITTHEGLPSNAIYGIAQDVNDALWLSTNKGLVRYDQNKNKMELFRSVDGLSSDEFNIVGYFSDEDDRIYFSSVNGISVIVNPNTVNNVKQNYLRFVKIKSGKISKNTYQLNNKDMMADDFDYGSAIEVWFSSMNYYKFGATKYRYKIEGFNNEWVNLGTSRRLFIAGLSAGHYELKVQSRISGEIWPTKYISYKFNVKTDFLNSQKFIVLLFITLTILFIIILLFVFEYFKKQLNRTKTKQSLEALRIKELRLSNDSLIYASSDKDRMIKDLNSELDDSKKKLDFERYRDITTGFYRFNYVLDLLEHDDQRDGKISDFLFKYTFVSIIEFSNYHALINQFGVLGANDYLSQVSIQLRRELNAGTQIYTLEDGCYLILNTTDNAQRISESLINLTFNFNQSLYEVTNGRTVKCDARLSLCSLEMIKAALFDDIIKIKRLILLAHKLGKQRNYKVITIVEILRELSCESLTENFDFELMIEDGTIKVSDGEKKS